MHMFGRKLIPMALPVAALAVALSGAAIESSAPAHADMNINASGGDNTKVDKDGTQGDFSTGSQGISRSGDQDAYANDSWAAAPQFKASPK